MGHGDEYDVALQPVLPLILIPLRTIVAVPPESGAAVAVMENAPRTVAESLNEVIDIVGSAFATVKVSESLTACRLAESDTKNLIVYEPFGQDVVFRE